MTTYINLCTRLRREVGASGSDTTVSGATGEWKRLCDWINQAWIDIQEEEPNWDWMRKSKSFSTTTNQGEYAYASSPLSLTDFARWRNGSFRLYETAYGDEQLLEQMPYDVFRDYFLLGSNRTTYSRPYAITVSPTDSLILGLAPNGVYTVVTEYYKTPAELSSDSDEPDMPSRYHMAIVYKAMVHYGLYEAAQEAIQRGQSEYQKMLERLRFDQQQPSIIHREFI